MTIEQKSPIRQEFETAGIYTYRYEREQPDYQLLICHGGGGWGGMYDRFAEPFSHQRNVEIWSFDLPGFGDTGTRGFFTAAEQLAATERIAAEMRIAHDVPIFALGSSMGSYHASAASYMDDLAGVVLSAGHFFCDGPGKSASQRLFSSPPLQALMGSPMGKSLMIDLDIMIDWEKNYGDQEHARWVVSHEKHTSQASLESWITLFEWEPPKPLSENDKPMIMLIAEADPLVPLELAKKGFDYIGGPTELVVFPTDQHQVMLFHTGPYSEALDEWARRQI